jgi:hypothetical protein
MTFRVDGVWDIETASWDRFVVGQAISATGERFTSWSEDDFARHLLAQSGCWYAHAGGRFDAIWLLDWLHRHGVPATVRLRGAGILSLTVGALEIRDSFAIAPMSLAKLAPLGGAQKIALSLPCECGTDCGGYCVLAGILDRGGPSSRERATVEAYLSADCDGLRAALDALASFAAGQGIPLGLTIGGTAWGTARAWLGLDAAPPDLARYRRLRGAYYGGRTEVFATEAAAGHRYDIHSSYPAALSRTALPVGPGQLRDRVIASRYFAAGKPCILAAEVEVPESDVPPLPYRATDRLLYPHGPVTGCWTSHELRHAVSCGAVVRRVAWGHVWDEESAFLAPFADRVWGLRAAAAAEDTAAGAARAAWCKWLANSLTGKLAQRPENESLRFLPSIGRAPPELDDGETILRVTAGGVWATRESVRVSPCAHVQLAAWLTSEARCELHRQLVHASARLYCDTDSVYSGHELSRRVGDALGEWGHEGALSDWRALAPKVYRYTDPDTGKVAVRGKGLSGLDAAGFAALETGEAWTLQRGVDGVRTALQRAGVTGSLFRRRSITRRLRPETGWCGGRELQEGETTTRATTVARYAKRDDA